MKEVKKMTQEQKDKICDKQTMQSIMDTLKSKDALQNNKK